MPLPAPWLLTDKPWASAGALELPTQTTRTTAFKLIKHRLPTRGPWHHRPLTNIIRGKLVSLIKIGNQFVPFYTYFVALNHTTHNKYYTYERTSLFFSLLLLGLTLVPLVVMVVTSNLWIFVSNCLQIIFTLIFPGQFLLEEPMKQTYTCINNVCVCVCVCVWHVVVP